MAESTRPLFVRPAPGRLIRHPQTMQPMPDDGFVVDGPMRFYFHRMMRAGDLVVAPHPPQDPRPAEQEKEEV
jgi:hypothetical protein